MILTLIDNSEWCKTTVVEEAADTVEIGREVELEMKPKDVTELLPSYDKTLIHEELLLVNEQRKWFPKTESIPGKDGMKIIEMTAKYLKYNINLVDKTAAGFERIDYNFERSLTVGKMQLNSIVCYREIIRKGRVNQSGKFNCF